MTDFPWHNEIDGCRGCGATDADACSCDRRKLRCIQPGEWRSLDGFWVAKQRTLMDVRSRDWVLYEDGAPVDGPGIDWPNLRSIREYIAEVEASRV